MFKYLTGSGVGFLMVGMHYLTGISMGLIFLISLFIIWGRLFAIFCKSVPKFLEECRLEDLAKKNNFPKTRNVTPHGSFTANDLRYMPKN